LVGTCIADLEENPEGKNPLWRSGCMEGDG